MKPFLLLLVVWFRRRLGSEPDDELLRRYRDGDAEAIGALYDRHGPFLLRYVGLTMGSWGHAEDVLQEAFARLMSVVEQGGEIQNARAFLTVTCRNLTIDQARRARKFPGPSLDDDPPAADLPREDRGPLDDVTDREFAGRLRSALDGLPDEQREAFLLKESLGYKFREIAEMTGVTESTVKSRLRYALSKLQAELGDFA
jgi:RNA polymerase sigma-70 factor (ECF subfamily)